MDKVSADLITAPDDDLADAGIDALRTGDDALVQRVDQALHMRYFHATHQNDREARTALQRLLDRIVQSKPARRIELSPVTERLARWHHLLSLLSAADAGEDPLVEARMYVAGSDYAARVLDEVAHAPVSRSRLLGRLRTANPDFSESSLSQLLGRMEARGLVFRRTAGREVEVCLGLTGKRYRETREPLPRPAGLMSVPASR